MNRLRVLFVDDEAMIREVMRIELPRMGHDVTVCESGEKALEIIETDSFDAAIVDLRMPGIDGWQVVDHLKEVSPDTQIIIHTAHGNLTKPSPRFGEEPTTFYRSPANSSTSRPYFRESPPTEHSLTKLSLSSSD